MLELELMEKDPQDNADDAEQTESDYPPRVALSPEEIEAEARAQYDRPRFSLRDLNDAVIELDIIEQIVDEMEGELTPELEARRDAALATLVQSADGMGDFKQAMTLEITARKGEEKRMERRRKAMEARYERVEKRFIEYCNRMGRTKIDGEYWTATIRTNAPSLKVTDQETVPAPYRTVQMVEEVTIDNKTLKADLVAWEKAHDAWRTQYDRWEQSVQDWDEEQQGEKPEAPKEPERPAPEKAAAITRSQSLIFK